MSGLLLLLLFLGGLFQVLGCKNSKANEWDHHSTTVCGN